MKTVIWGKCKTTFIQKWGNQSSVLPSIQYVEIGGVVVFSRIYNYRIIEAIFGPYIYIYILILRLGVFLMGFRGLSYGHTNPYQVAIALENAAESGLSIEIADSETLDSSVRRRFGMSAFAFVRQFDGCGDWCKF